MEPDRRWPVLDLRNADGVAADQETIAMFDRLATSGQDRITELQRSVRGLDRVLARMSETLAGGARSAESARDSAFEDSGELAGRVRGGAERFGEEAMRLSRRAGDISVDRFAKDIGLPPLAILGIAIGVGALIGAVRYRSAVSGPSPGRRRVAARTPASKGKSR